MTRCPQGFLEELLGSSRVSLLGKPEVDRSTGGIDSTIQVPPDPALANVRFVDPPGAVGRFQFPPASLVHLGCVALHPTPYGRVISPETSFDEQFLDVPIGKREPQIPTDRANDELRLEVPPFEQRWPQFDHGIYCSLSDSFTELLQHSPTPWTFDVFRSKGGGRAYFHGGLSPQELIIPVVVMHSTVKSIPPSTGIQWTLTPGTTKLTTRFFSVQIAGTGTSLFGFEPPKVRIELRANKKCVSV